MGHVHVPRRRALTLLALVVTLGLAAVGLSRCRTAPDTVTGMEFSRDSRDRHGPADCMHRCNAAFMAARFAELARHRQALRGCGRDRACREAAIRRHRENLLRLLRDMQLCKRACYNEGAGTAGR